MKKVVTLLICSVLFLILAGCGTKSMGGAKSMDGTKSLVVLLPDPDGNVGQLVVATDVGQQVLTGANQSVQTSGRKTPPTEATKLSDDQIQSAFSEALAAQPRVPVKFILYFVQNSTELVGKSKADLPKIIHSIQERASTDIVISGHTDTVGEMGYNYKLSLDRAKLMNDILISNGAVPANITVTSHGEGNPLIKTADNVPEPRNRRVEVVIK